jgi:hypothetical protein
MRFRLHRVAQDVLSDEVVKPMGNDGYELWTERDGMVGRGLFRNMIADRLMTSVAVFNTELCLNTDAINIMSQK